jgi:radical SAM superfamily enzyme YgiQ (UPF0313 family)
MTEERLKMIKRAGCWIMEVGIESGSDRILKFIKKGNTKAEIAAAVGRAKDLGIKIKGNFIFGLPTETRESLEETIQFATSIGLHLFQQTYMTILPGCELALEAHKHGEFDADWSKITMFRVNYIPSGLTKEDLIVASKKAFRRFYLRPKVIFRFAVQSCASFRAIRGLMISFFAFLKTVMRKTI